MTTKQIESTKVKLEDLTELEGPQDLNFSFEVVSDEFRTQARGSIEPNPLMKLLLEGRTVKVLGDLPKPSKYYRWAKALNKRFRRRAFEGFVVVWLEDAKPKE